MSHVNTRQHAQSETIKKDRVSKQIPKQKNQSLNELVYLYLLKSVNLFQDGTADDQPGKITGREPAV